jgi:hypothetical protein
VQFFARGTSEDLFPWATFHRVSWLAAAVPTS